MERKTDLQRCHMTSVSKPFLPKVWHAVSDTKCVTLRQSDLCVRLCLLFAIAVCIWAKKNFFYWLLVSDLASKELRSCHFILKLVKAEQQNQPVFSVPSENWDHRENQTGKTDRWTTASWSRDLHNNLWWAGKPELSLRNGWKFTVDHQRVINSRRTQS